MTIKYPVFRPLLPTIEALAPYIKEIDENRWYTNHGPLLVRFEQQLSQYFGVELQQLTTSANATLAMAQVLKAFGVANGKLCIMPSWTFAATPAAAIWAGLTPYFCDVDPANWIITPEYVRELAKTHRIGAVIAVSAFGAPLEVSVWDRFTVETGIPVIIDAAAGFDSFSADRIKETITPIVISLHATKVSGIGEGAIIIARDENLLSHSRSYGNFGFMGSREAMFPGFNAKMSEYSAAIGLAMLNGWAEQRAEWDHLTKQFFAAASLLPKVSLAPGFAQGWISSYGLIHCPDDFPATHLSKLLLEQGIETRQWWGTGCHTQEAYKNYGHDHLTTTKKLGQFVLGLPFWLGMETQDIDKIFSHVAASFESRETAVQYG